jgi:SAM-dependent methyltransferase
MKEVNQQYFDKISSRYQRAADSWQEIYEQMEARINPLIEGKVVLDIGNGGRFAYDTSLPSRVIAMDIAPTMLDKIEDPKIVKVVGDGRDMQTIEDESVDIIIFLLVLHHINGSSVRESFDTLDKVLSLARRKIRPGGYLIVTEALLSHLLFRIQRFFFPLTRFVLSRFGVGMIFFFSLPLLRKRISQKFQLETNDCETIKLRLKGWFDPIGGSFPGLLKIPAWLSPYDFRLIIVPRKLVVCQD